MVLGTLILGIPGPGARNPYFGYQDQGISEGRTYSEVPRKEYRVQSTDYRVRIEKNTIQRLSGFGFVFPTI